MENRANKFKVGLFIAIGLILFFIAIVVIGSKENLFTPTFHISSEFKKVSGLTQGAVVRFNGIAAGKVDNLQITETGSVIVHMSVEKRIQEFIKTDSKASIISEGLVGNKIVEIVAGSTQAKSVGNDDFIAAVPPIDAEDIFRNLQESSVKATEVAQNIAEITDKVNKGEGTLGSLISNDEIARNLNLMSMNLASSSRNFNTLSMKLNGTADNVTGDLAMLSANLRTMAGNIEQVIFKLQNGEGVAGTVLTDTAAGNDLKQFMKNLNTTSKSFEVGAYSFAQNMEALKHNFLFKGYFEDIGYWDKTTNKSKKMKKNEQDLQLDNIMPVNEINAKNTDTESK